MRTTNLAAIGLYRSLGFVVEGTKRNAIFVDGRYFDSHVMALVKVPG